MNVHVPAGITVKFVIYFQYHSVYVRGYQTHAHILTVLAMGFSQWDDMQLDV
ncbi:hypothetical protein SAMN06264855_106103 [Halorubrum vacuolatum]|uniref:Uncharacterized protein n=1 Tax=Halorubrum vacuolatum TaxID=63740 RepID=A0A238WB61_HALVU|nr:hypothetical protein SAMN06264855_106103 [Halorubrum vacuolatum]